MYIGNYKSNPTYHISFKSGLTKDILNDSFKITPKEVESFLCAKKNIDCNFLNNTPNTIGTLLTEHIFSKLASISQGFGAKPPRIRTFITEDLVKPQNQNFCIKDSQIVLKSEPPFEMRSIFYKQEKSLKDIDEQIEEEFYQGKRSSNHFLADYIHEWIHNIHLNAIYSKHGYGGKCPYGQSQYPNTNYNKTGIWVLNGLVGLGCYCLRTIFNQKREEQEQKEHQNWRFVKMLHIAMQDKVLDSRNVGLAVIELDKNITPEPEDE